MARRAAVICSSSLQPSNGLPYARLANILIPGLSLGGEQPGAEGGAGDAAKHFANPTIDYKFSARNMVRENASVAALSLCANAAELGNVVPEKDWLMLVKTLHGLTSARVRALMHFNSCRFSQNLHSRVFVYTCAHCIGVSRCFTSVDLSRRATKHFATMIVTHTDSSSRLCMLWHGGRNYRCQPL